MQTEVAIVGAGSIGISIAYYLKRLNPAIDVVLIDSHQPMTLTSASSGENFRNWWPHPVLKNFFDHSLDLLDQLDRQLHGTAVTSRRGYLLASREDQPADLIAGLQSTFAADELRAHQSIEGYRQALDTDQSGVDIVNSAALVRSLYPGFDSSISSVYHIRRGGILDAQHIAEYMLGDFRRAGGKVLTAKVSGVQSGSSFELTLDGAETETQVKTSTLVNAAGPYAETMSAQLGIDLPLINVLQQKVAFEDSAGVIDRSLPFCIDLDPALLSWSDDERAAIADDPEYAPYTELMPGSIHCRPEGPKSGSWVKLGWAFNQTPGEPSREPTLDPVFPEIAVRGASRLQPGLARYLSGFPGSVSHYGGYYTMTDENWPLIGKTPTEGYFLATAMSGFGSMGALATGELLGNQILGNDTPDWFQDLGLARYAKPGLMEEIRALNDKGLL